MISTMRTTAALVPLLAAALAAQDAAWATFAPPVAKANGKRIVLLAGDEEYRSEESLPMLGKLLAERHGFHCTVLFSIDPKTGVIDPGEATNVPGMQLLDKADLVVLAFRFRELPDRDMQHFVDYVQAGKPVLAIRTATHAFHYTRDPKSPFAAWDFASQSWPGGFGQQVLGETWISHHGDHGSQATRGLVDGTNAGHPVLRSVRDVYGPTDVYGVVHLLPTDTVLLHGLVLQGMQPDSPSEWRKSLMPLVWTRDHTWPNGKTTRSLTTTIGAAVDLQSEDLRRLLINANYWLTGLEVPAKADATIVGDYQPSPFGFGKHKPGVKPADLERK